MPVFESDLWPLGLMRRRAGQRPPAVDARRPRSIAELQEILSSSHSGAIVARGGGSGVCGAVSASAGDVLLDLTGLSRVQIDESNLCVRAQAGVVLGELEQLLNERGLTLGHHPASLPVATVGGLISTRSSGQASSFYGSIEDMLLGLSALLADGRLVAARAPIRSAIGPALHQLFCGAEGGLGVIVEASLKVHRLPEAVLGTAYAAESVEQGLTALQQVTQAGLNLYVGRLYDEADSVLQGQTEGCLLLISSAGPLRRAKVDLELMESQLTGLRPLGDPLWRRWLDHRYDLSAERLQELLAGAGSYLDTIEVAQTWTGLPELYREVRARLAETAQLVLCHFSHASEQGCCAYFTFAGSAEAEEDAERLYRRSWDAALRAALAQGAVLSHHHGVGRLKAPYVTAEMGGWSEIWTALRDSLDPQGRLNPNAVGGVGPGGRT
ncbi:MAG: FAD-binding oxidoreductase [Candidatus Dormibacteraeota bacterium]|nr:FAD-binding oxidoreductase [Candidatus Dormibacteraeota bacterium]